MFKDVQVELEVLKHRMFTGHVKFGMEHGVITSMSITSKAESFNYAVIEDLETEIKKVFPKEEDFYGALDFNFNFGEIESQCYSTSLHGEQLKNRLRTNQGREVKQCKNVLSVEKKSNT